MATTFSPLACTQLLLTAALLLVPHIARKGLAPSMPTHVRGHIATFPLCHFNMAGCQAYTLLPTCVVDTRHLTVPAYTTMLPARLHSPRPVHHLAQQRQPGNCTTFDRQACLPETPMASAVAARDVQTSAVQTSAVAARLESTLSARRAIALAASGSL